MFWANFIKIDMVKKNRELGVLTSGIKRDGHQKTRELENPGIRSSGN